MRKWTPLLLATAVLHLSLPGPARAAEPCLTNCQAEGPGAAGAPLDREAERARDAEEQRLDEQRRRLEKAERARAELEQAQADQRRLETFEEESVSATRRRVGGMALTMAATTGCLTGLALYLGTKGTRTGERSYRPIAHGLAGFSVVTAILGAGFLISGFSSDTRDVALDVGRDRLTASLGFRFF